jgi:L-malate glycosyltransferase
MPIRVFHLIKGFDRGGAEKLLLEGLRSADRERFEYRYGYFLPQRTALVPELRALGAEVTCFRARYAPSILLSARRVATHLRQWKADLLHCHLPLAGITGRLAGRMAGVPVVYTEHNRMERYHPLSRWLGIRTWGWQEQVIAVSESVAESIHRHIESRVPVEVVFNGVDVDHFSVSKVEPGAVRRRLGIPAEAPVVGTVAGFRAQKRLPDWMEAAHRLRERHPGVRFLVVGDGAERDRIVARAVELGLNGTVHFVGVQQDVRPYLAAMDVYLISSAVEGLPVAMLEAMAMERPVVSTAVGGIPEVVRHGENGLLVEPARPGLLAEEAARLLASPDARRRCGVAARATVQARFGMSRMAREVEGIYLDVLERWRDGR